MLARWMQRTRCRGEVGDFSLGGKIFFVFLESIFIMQSLVLQRGPRSRTYLISTLVGGVKARRNCKVYL